MKTKKFLVAIVLGIMSIILLQTPSQAVLQSNFVNAKKSDTATNWVIRVRQMEEQGGGMGLNEVVDGTTGLSTSGTNGIDVHLQKNTEYGAVVLLGASDYGKQGVVGGTGADRYMDRGSETLIGTDIKATSTGNVTGVYQLGISPQELTAAGRASFLSNIASRYKNIYEDNEVKLGDATIENGVNLGTSWHGSNRGNFANDNNIVLMRGRSPYGGSYGVGVFSFDRTYLDDKLTARAVVVSYPGI